MIIRKSLAVVALVGAGALPVPAAADDGPPVLLCRPGSVRNWIPVEKVMETAARRGLRPQRIQVERGCYEVVSADAAGRKTETYIDPATGSVVMEKVDDGD